MVTKRKDITAFKGFSTIFVYYKTYQKFNEFVKKFGFENFTEALEVMIDHHEKCNKAP